MDKQGESEHIVKSYEQELGRLKALLTQMGGMVEAQAANASRALVEHNATAASYAVQDDLAVDKLEREIADLRHALSEMAMENHEMQDVHKRRRR